MTEATIAPVIKDWPLGVHLLWRDNIDLGVL